MFRLGKRFVAAVDVGAQCQSAQHALRVAFAIASVMMRARHKLAVGEFASDLPAGSMLAADVDISALSGMPT